MRFKRCVFGLVMLLPTTVFAQGSADLVGRVTDPSGAVLPGVTVSVRNLGTNDVRTTTTNVSGDFAFSLLPIGRYTVTIELAGFKTQTANVTLATGDRARLDARLEVGTGDERLRIVLRRAAARVPAPLS
ncbi:MAG: hypothetical protein GEU99_14020 [Luteitalea sp.]|nr:hypothetical protein [Luteitalea sp.]